VKYKDGRTETIPLRIGMNIYWVDAKPLDRGTNDNRYIFPLKDKNSNYNFLYQLEWINPHPEKEIEKVTYKHDNIFDFNLLLFAISGREVK
jgi:hypothetical protein